MTTRKKAAAKAPAKRTRTPKAPTRIGLLLPVSHEERWRMIAEAAYYIAQQRGFAGGDATADWLAAESAVDARLKAEGRRPE
jgi:Protein of unknown function (DUF2934)